MLRIITGRSATGKSHKILDEIYNMYKENPTGKYILLVPEQYSLEASDAFIEKMSHSGHIHMDVLSFTRLAHYVFLQKGKKDRIQIDDMGKTVLLHKIMRENINNLKVYGRLAGRIGFLEKFNSSISAMKRSQISASEIRTNADNHSQKLLKDKLHDIALLYENFELKMQNTYLDEEDYLKELIDLMEDVNFIKDAYIWIDGFNGFSEQEYCVIKKMMSVSKHITVSLTLANDMYSQDKSLFEPTYATFNTLIEMAKDNNINYKIIPMKNMGGYSNNQKEICKWAYRAFSQPVVSNNKSGNYNIIKPYPVSINEYSSRRDEVLSVGRKIISLVRDYDYIWRDITIATTSSEAYEPMIKREFAIMGIPYFIDEKMDVLSTPLVQYLLSLIRFFAYGYKMEDGVSILKTGLTELSDEESMLLENHILALGIDGWKWWKTYINNSSKFGSLFNLDKDKDISLNDGIELNKDNSLIKTNELDDNCYCDDEILWILFDIFMKPLYLFKDKIENSQSVKMISQNLFEHIENCGIYHKVQDYAQNLYSQKKWKYAHEAVQIYNAVLDVLDQLVSLIADDEVSLIDYYKLFETGVKVQKIAVIPPAKDNVLIASIDRSRTHDVKAVFILGANEGSLPKINQEHDLLSDFEKRKLKSEGFNIFSDVDNSYMEERLSIYQMMCKAKEILYISYPISDMDNMSLKPSLYVSRFEKAGANIIKYADNKYVDNEYRDNKYSDNNYTDDKLDMITSYMSTMEDLINNQRELKKLSKLDLFWHTLESVYNDEYKIYQRISNAYKYNNSIVSLGEEWANNFYTNALTGGFGRFESYTKCPFSHFVSYGLKPKPRKTYGLDLPDLGIIYHNIMEKFTSIIGRDVRSWQNLSSEKISEILFDIVDSESLVHKNGILHETSKYKYMINRIKRISKRSIDILVKQINSGRFIPHSWELEFASNKQDALKPIFIALSNENYLKLEGRVDRVDSMSVDDKTYINIIDYKSGSKKWSLFDVYEGISIQLVAYMDTILKYPEQFKSKNLSAGGVFYFHIDDPMIKFDSEFNFDKARDNIDEDIFKLMKLSGVLCDEKDLLEGMESNISSIIKTDEFNALINHVRRLLVDTGEKIYQGNIQINPLYTSGVSACQYCEYKAICRFDTSFESDNYRYIKKCSDAEIIQKLQEKFQSNTNIK